MSQTQFEKSVFIGRKAELTLFEQRLTGLKNSQQQPIIYYIWGVVGVGKTALVEQYRRIAMANGFSWGAMPSSTYNLAHGLAEIAQRLKKEGWSFGPFLDRYQLLITQGADLREKTMRQGIQLGATVGDALIPIPLFSAGYQLFDLITTWRNHDLLNNLVASPDNLLDLFTATVCTGSKEKKVVISVDADDLPGDSRDEWLRELVTHLVKQERQNVVLVVTGHRSIKDDASWLDFRGWVREIHLDVFSQDETTEMMRAYGISDSEMIERAGQAAKGLPLFLYWLAKDINLDQKTIPDLRENAHSFFLKRIADPLEKQGIVEAAVLRSFNQGHLASLFGQEQAVRLENTLKQKPFILQNDRKEWVYHPAIRAQFIQYLRENNRNRYTELHGRIAEFYEANRTKVDQAEPAYQSLTANALYHRFCHDPANNLPITLNVIIYQYLNGQYDSSLTMALQQAEEDSAIAEKNRWGNFIPEKEVQSTLNVDRQVAFYQRLLNYPGLKDEYRPHLYFMLSMCRRISIGAIELNHPLPTGDVADQRSRLIDLGLCEIDRAIAINHNEPLYPFQRGQLLQLAGKYENAVVAYSTSIQAGLMEGVVFQCRAECYAAQGDFSRAMEDIDQAIALDHTNPDFFINKGAYCEAKNDFQGAIDNYRHAISLDPQNPNGFLALSHVYEDNKMWAEAAEAATTMIDSVRVKQLFEGLELFYIDWETDHSQAIAILHKTRATCYFHMNKHDDAIKDYSSYIETGMASADIYMLRGECYWHTNQPEKAFQDYQVAINKDPLNSVFRGLRGYHYTEVNKLRAALDDFNVAVEQAPGDPTPYFHRGLTYYEMGRLDLAISDFDDAIRLDPSHYHAIYWRGVCHANSNPPNVSDAISDLETALKQIPEIFNDEAIRTLVVFYSIEGRIDEAQDLILNPTYAKFFNGLESDEKK